jgi:hypothetical protein
VYNCCNNNSETPNLAAATDTLLTTGLTSMVKADYDDTTGNLKPKDHWVVAVFRIK